MKYASLFSGIGGFDLAAELMGGENIFHCEINPFCQQVLKYYWPNATSYKDIKQTDFAIHRGTIDILTGGFPCQPYSAAGKRKGKEDERHLWPHMLRAVREIQPRWVVGENVRGLTNWNGGMVFDEVQADLEAEGYKVLPFLLPACAVNAPHRRDRIWFVAYNSNARIKSVRRERENAVYESEVTPHPRNKQFQEWSPKRNGSHKTENGTGMDDRSKRSGNTWPASHTHSNVHAGGLDTRGDNSEATGSQGQNEQQTGWNENRERIRVESGTGSEVTAHSESSRDRGELRGLATHNESVRQSEEHRQNDMQHRNNGGEWTTPNSPSIGIQRNGAVGQQEPRTQTGTGLPGRNDAGDYWSEWPTQSPLCSRDDGLSSRLAGITFSKHRNESIKGYGNAVVPQVVLQIFRAIEQYELSLSNI